MSKPYYCVDTYRSQDSLGYLVKLVHSLMTGVMEPVFEARGFTFLQYLILAWVFDGIAVNSKDICKKYHYDSGALSRVIDQLAKRGLLQRIHRDRDRRKVDLKLTTAGRIAVHGLRPTVVENLNLMLADFSSAEVQEFQRLLLKLSNILPSVAPDKRIVPAEG